MANPVVDLLRQSSVFAGLADGQLRKLAGLLKERQFNENQVLFEQDDPGDTLYLITDGRVKVTATDGAGNAKVLRFSGAGDFLGLIELLTGEPRSATALATTKVKSLQLAKDDFDVFVASDIGVLRGLLNVVNRGREQTDLRASEESSASSGATMGRLTVVFSPRGGAGTSTIAANLGVALAQRSPDGVALVDLDVMFGKAGLLLNLSPRTTVSAISANALQHMDRETLDFYLTSHVDSSLRVLAGTLRPEDADLVTGDHVKAALELLRRHFAHVVVDTRRSFSEVNLTAIEVANEVLVICTPDRLAARGVLECLRIFAGVLRLPPESFELVS